MRLKSILIAGSTAFCLASAPASAQSVAGAVGIAERSRPDYDPIGEHLGSFTLYPSITTGVQATDNYLASDTNRRGDVYLSLQPELLLRNNGQRNHVEARGFLIQSLHATLPSENATQYGANASSAFDISHDLQIRADVSGARYIESRASFGSFIGSSKPVQFDSYHAGLGISERVNDLTLSGNAAVNYLNYYNTSLSDGTPVDQNYRDVRSDTFGGSAQYALRNGFGLIVSGNYSEEHYRVGPGSPGFLASGGIDRDSHGVTLQGGVTLELTKLIFGSLQIGYITRKYVDPRLLNFSGLSFNGDVLWNVTPLTSLRFKASRSVDDSSSTVVAGNVRSDFHLSVDHELYRYVILSGDIGYAHFQPNGIGIGGDEYTVGTRARYLINRRFSLTGGLRYSGRASSSSFIRYHAVLGDVGVKVSF